MRACTLRQELQGVCAEWHGHDIARGALDIALLTGWCMRGVFRSLLACGCTRGVPLDRTVRSPRGKWEPWASVTYHGLTATCHAPGCVL